MAALDTLFPGFEGRSVPTEAGRIFTLSAGSGRPLVLLHGFPETLAMWHAIAPTLAKTFRVVLMDLRGYGWSSAPHSENGEAYTKRRMGTDVVAVMDAFGASRFALAGHDRGGRVGYRLALDQPGRVTKLALLDIYPTFEVWRSIEGGSDASPHWPRLARPAPEPENEIAGDPSAYFEGLMRKWAKGSTLERFDRAALTLYRDAWGDRTRIHAFCEDYRAGATLDRADDEADEATGKTIACPVRILASSTYLTPFGSETPLDIWHRTFAPGADGVDIDSGHFIAEENPRATLEALRDFF